MHEPRQRQVEDEDSAKPVWEQPVGGTELSTGRDAAGNASDNASAGVRARSVREPQSQAVDQHEWSRDRGRGASVPRTAEWSANRAPYAADGERFNPLSLTWDPTQATVTRWEELGDEPFVPPAAPVGSPPFQRTVASSAAASMGEKGRADATQATLFSGPDSAAILASTAIAQEPSQSLPAASTPGPLDAHAPTAKRTPREQEQELPITSWSQALTGQWHLQPDGGAAVPMLESGASSTAAPADQLPDSSDVWGQDVGIAASVSSWFEPGEAPGERRDPQMATSEVPGFDSMWVSFSTWRDAGRREAQTGTDRPEGVNGTSAPCSQGENIVAVSPIVETNTNWGPTATALTRQSPEVAPQAGEDEVMEDEAAIAVREAALRAAAQVGSPADSSQQGGTVTDPTSPQGKVSRETFEPQPGNGFEAGDSSVEAMAAQDGAARVVDSATAAKNARVTFRVLAGAGGPRCQHVIAVANQKGGVGKSTTAVNLGAYLALAGARILVVDLDPQGNASTGLGLDHRRIEPSVYDVLTGEAEPAQAIRQAAVTNLHVLPSTIDLAGAEVELVNAFSRETRLRRALDSVRHNYDIMLVDCPPSLGLLTVNALAACDELLIPIQCEYYALEGLGQLLRNVDLVRANLNTGLQIGGIVLTMYDGRTRLAEQVVDEVRKHFTDLVYRTIVPRSVRLSEAPGYGVPIALYDPLSRGGIAYRDLASELAERTGLLAPIGEGAS